MNSLLRTCGLAAMAVGVTCLTLGTAEAGGRRYCGCQQYQPNYYYTAPTTYAAPATAATTDGHQRYQSAYQAPATTYSNDGYHSNNGYYSAPANNFYYGSAHYGNGIPLNFQERSFHDQWDAGRKIRGY
jgi:hypothetical protein